MAFLRVLLGEERPGVVEEIAPCALRERTADE
jgi:hypothetical protein